MTAETNQRNHLTVDGIEYDVSNLFLPPTPCEPSRQERRGGTSRQSLSQASKSSASCAPSKSAYYQSSKSSDGAKKALSKSNDTSFQINVDATYIRSHGGSKECEPTRPSDYYQHDSEKHHEARSYFKQMQYEDDDMDKKPSPEEFSPRSVVDEGRRFYLPTIEIEPGVRERLRGSKETARAIQLGRVQHVLCFCCNQDVSCIQDAAYVICPSCRVISPVPNGLWGVGLGFLAYSS